MANTTGSFNDDQQSAGEETQTGKKGRPSYEKIADIVFKKLEFRFQQLDGISHLLNGLKSEIGLLRKENYDLHKENVELRNKFTKIESVVNDNIIENIRNDRKARENSFIIHGLKANTPLLELKRETASLICINPEERDFTLTVLGKQTEEKNPVKITFKDSVDYETRKQILRKNIEFRSSNINVKIDNDRSLTDRKLNKALLSKRYELRNENPQITYKINMNNLIGTDNSKYTYNLIEEKFTTA